MLSDKIAAQKELVEEKERLAVTLQSIGDGVIATDNTGRVVLINTVGEKLTGWNEKEAKGKKLSEVFTIVDEYTHKKAGNPVERVFREKRIIGLANHTVLVSKDGTKYNIMDSAAPIKGKNGEINGVVLVFRDVTEKLKAEKELSKINKLESI